METEILSPKEKRKQETRERLDRLEAMQVDHEGHIVTDERALEIAQEIDQLRAELRDLEKS